MGYFIDYYLKLKIKRENCERALEIFNYLHSKEMLDKYARGGSSTGEKWYSWVNNPEEPYKKLFEAFKNWSIIDSDNDNNYYFDDDFFIVQGSYSSKLGQQDFLLKQLESVLEDTTIHIHGEDDARFQWIITDYKFSQKDI